ncbi:uncharacterized protein Dana_GF27803 [Drosophila ananassae]|uniref:Uncharacterized protein n=1 Tax=Drosophila ananassae TaxID=7217 RepID=A0A0P8ZYF4_DROAN|nr:uncharacterized protein LOC26515212 [Drosophila ananassae]KPU79688.1 uncharacterized protein Dana_GF27803 [Drosophila ananassae]
MKNQKNYFPKTGYFQQNSSEEADRTYGLLKANRLGTPLPSAAKNLNTSELTQKLNMEQRRSLLSQILDPMGSESSRSSDLSMPSVPPKSGMSFAMKRKLFDQAEFTITKGVKMSDYAHPLDHVGKFQFLEGSSPYESED